MTWYANGRFQRKSAKVNTVVIARYSMLKLASALTVGYAPAAALFLITLYHPAGQTLFEYISAKGEFWVPVIVFGWICGIASASMPTVALVQVLYHRGKAIWTSDDRVFFLNRIFVAVKRSDIQNVSIGSIGHSNWPAIILSLRNGSKKTISTWAFSEPAQTTLSRLDNWAGSVVFERKQWPSVIGSAHGRAR